LDGDAFVEPDVFNRHVLLVGNVLSIAVFCDSETVDGDPGLGCNAIVDVFAAVCGEGVCLCWEVLDWLSW